jgi:hypothetical protein
MASNRADVFTTMITELVEPEMTPYPFGPIQGRKRSPVAASSSGVTVEEPTEMAVTMDVLMGTAVAFPLRTDARASAWLDPPPAAVIPGAATASTRTSAGTRSRAVQPIALAIPDAGSLEFAATERT